MPKAIYPSPSVSCFSSYRTNHHYHYYHYHIPFCHCKKKKVETISSFFFLLYYDIYLNSEEWPRSIYKLLRTSLRLSRFVSQLELVFFQIWIWISLNCLFTLCFKRFTIYRWDLTNIGSKFNARKNQKLESLKWTRFYFFFLLSLTRCDCQW